MTKWKQIEEGIDYTTYVRFPSSDSEPMLLKTVSKKTGQESFTCLSQEAFMILANSVYYSMHMMND